MRSRSASQFSQQIPNFLEIRSNPFPVKTLGAGPSRDKVSETSQEPKSRSLSRAAMKKQFPS